MTDVGSLRHRSAGSSAAGTGRPEIRTTLTTANDSTRCGLVSAMPSSEVRPSVRHVLHGLSREIMLLVEEATDTSLLSACRHYGYYIANRAWELCEKGLCGRHRRRRRRNSENLDVLSLSLQEHPARCPPDADSETRTSRRLCWDCWNAKVAKEMTSARRLGRDRCPCRAFPSRRGDHAQVPVLQTFGSCLRRKKPAAQRRHD